VIIKELTTTTATVTENQYKVQYMNWQTLN